MTYSVEEKIRAYVGVVHQSVFPFAFEGFFYFSVENAITVSGPARILREAALAFWEGKDDIGKLKIELVDRLAVVRDKPIYIFTLGGIWEDYSIYSPAPPVSVLVDRIFDNALSVYRTRLLDVGYRGDKQDIRDRYYIGDTLGIEYKTYLQLSTIISGCENASSDNTLESLLLHHLYRSSNNLEKLSFDNVRFSPPEGYQDWLLDFLESVHLEYSAAVKTVLLKTTDDDYFYNLCRHKGIPVVYQGDPEGVVAYIQKHIARALLKRGVKSSEVLGKYLFIKFLSWQSEYRNIYGYAKEILTQITKLINDEGPSNDLKRLVKCPTECVFVYSTPDGLEPSLPESRRSKLRAWFKSK